MIEDTKYTVYKHTTPSGKVYIGITEQKPEKRWQNGNGYKHNKHFYNAILKYGWENIEHDVLYDGLTKEQACNKEIDLIAKYDATNPKHGYNNSTGGECSAVGARHSQEARKRKSELIKEEYKTGKRVPTTKGKHLSEETRKKLSEANKGQKQTPQQRKALMNYLVGHKVSDETRQKLREANIGRTPWNKGKKASEEAKEKNRIVAIKLGKIPPYIKPTKVMCVETGEVFQQIKYAGEKYGICPANITAVCRHRREKAGGYHWKYVES